jgi:hypothetical protein
MLEPKKCLENHIQYVCGSCGRCICIDKDEKRNVQRWNFPFKSLDIAKLYLRTADFTIKKPCGIYEIINFKGRKSYKIFAQVTDLKKYLGKNKDKKCESMKPVYIKDVYKHYNKTKIKKLSKQEVEIYLQAQYNIILIKKNVCYYFLYKLFI